MAGGYGDPELAERSKIYYIAGAWDPTTQATLAPKGSLYLRVGANGGPIYQKLDDGKTTNWVLNQTSGGGGGSIPVTQNIYVEPNGSDVTGDGSRSKPFQSINAAIAVCTNPALVYTIVPGSGDYSGPDVTWLPNVCMIGSGAARVNNNINYVSPAGSESYFFFENVGMGGIITLDLSLAAIAIHTFTTGSYTINRIDSKGYGPWVVLVSDSILGDCDFGGNNILSNALFVSSLKIKTGGTVLLGNSPVGIPVDLYGSAVISFQASNTQGAVLTGHIIGPDTPTIITDSAGLIGATYTDCNVLYGNSNGTLTTGMVQTGGLLSATSYGADVCGFATNDGKIEAVANGSMSAGYAEGAGSNVRAAGEGSEARGYVGGGGIIQSNGFGSKARGVATTGAVISSIGDASTAFGFAQSGLISATKEASLAFGRILGNSGSIKAETASLSFGWTRGSGLIGNVSSISNRANLVFGDAENNTTGNIQALGNAIGSLVFGNLNSNTGGIESGSSGSLVFGQTSGSGKISASSGANGSVAFGVLNNGSSGSIIVNNTASLAFGSVSGTGSITSNRGGVSFGLSAASSITSDRAGLSFGSSGLAAISSNFSSLSFGITQSGAISSTSACLAFGSTDVGNIVGGGGGSIAAGFALNFSIMTQANGCRSGGYAETGAIIASGVASFAHGDDINSAGDYSACFGQGHQTNNSYQFKIGSYSDNTRNPLFAIGNGFSGFTSNAFEVSTLGIFKTSAHQIKQTRLITAGMFPYTVNSAGQDDVVVAVTNAPGLNIDLPSVGVNDGDTYTIKLDENSTNDLTVTGVVGNIEGSPNITLKPNATSNFNNPSSITVCFANTKWQIIAKG